MALTLSEAVQWYYSFARFDPNVSRAPDNLKLARMNEILARLGNPHQQFPSVVIAGTKGKGSTAALLDSILHSAGYRTGLYTSPHLHSFRERIRVNEELISKIHVVQGTSQLQALAPQFSQATFFEWVTALAFDYFARQRVEIAVVEVGLGGRLDCTNVLTPRVSLITPISYDHVEILGDALEKIAYEKAGIIKPEIPVVVAPQEPEPLRVIREVAAEQNAPLVDVAKEWRWELVGSTVEGQVVDIQRMQDETAVTYHLPLLGPHQRTNLVTALSVASLLREQGWKIGTGPMQQGAQRVQWHARFEILARPLPPGVSPGESIWSQGYLVADGAHNRASARELRRTLDEVFPGAPVHFVFGASSDKDIRGMLGELLPRASSVIFTQSHHARAASPNTLARIAAPFLVPLHTADTLVEALLRAKALAAPNDIVCLTGSLFVAAEAREIVLGLPKEE